MFRTFSTFCFVFALCLVGGIAMSDEKRLIKHLLENYEKVGIYGRPVYNKSETVSVYFGIGLLQLIAFDETKQILTLKVWLRHMWNDILLQWNEDDFGGLDEVRLPIHTIWKPDITLYNSADTGVVHHDDALAVVSKNGEVLWIPGATASITCAADLTNFPYDKHSCSLKFGSWTYHGFHLDVGFYDGVAEIDLSNYIQSQEFELLNSTANKNVLYYPCCAEPYPDITFNIRFLRKHAVLGRILISPSILLALLTLVTFWLPSNSVLRVIFGLLIFLCLAFLQITMIPSQTSSTPLIAIFISMIMRLDFVAILWSAVAINLSKLESLPCCRSKQITRYLSCLLCVRYKSETSTKGDETELCPAEGSENSTMTTRDDGARRGYDGLLLATLLDRVMFMAYVITVIVCITVFIPKP